MSADISEKYQCIVAQGGGKYIGMMENLVLFNSHKTGNTLAIPEKDLTILRVRAMISESNKQFGF